jgi:hypothetical protein
VVGFAALSALAALRVAFSATGASATTAGFFSDMSSTFFLK